jgi:UDP-N-acetylglucosamine--N-acetylmuramyl-(pentapeptide) pyrophosphoryl-undecaprenol N-acetylglucosamine transferase
MNSRTLNESMLHSIDKVIESGVTVIWQTGSFYYSEVQERLKGKVLENIHVLEFIEKMNLTYAVADVIISRAGATSISELQVVGKPVVFVPSPNVAEDHQTKNAMSLVERDAALIVSDSDAREKLLETALDLIKDDDRKAVLSANIKEMAKPNATVEIVDQIEELIR